jgi:hypothetical protein
MPKTDEANAFGLGKAGEIGDRNADESENGIDVIVFQRIDNQMKAIRDIG